LSATQRKVTKEKSPLGNDLIKLRNHLVGFTNSLAIARSNSVNPSFPTRLACFMANHFPMRMGQDVLQIVR